MRKKAARIYKAVSQGVQAVRGENLSIQQITTSFWGNSNHSGKGKKHPKGLKETVGRDHTRLGIVSGFNCQTRKHCNSQSTE